MWEGFKDFKSDDRDVEKVITQRQTRANSLFSEARLILVRRRQIKIEKPEI